MKTVYLIGFPGVGKTYAYNSEEFKDLKLADSDSSQYSWIFNNGKKERNPNFIEDYKNHLMSLDGEYDYVFVSTHEDVVKMVTETFYHYYIVYPSIVLKDAYIEKYKERKSDDSFIKLMTDHYENFVYSIDINDIPRDKKIKFLSKKQTLTDVIKFLE